MDLIPRCQQSPNEGLLTGGDAPRLNGVGWRRPDWKLWSERDWKAAVPTARSVPPVATFDCALIPSPNNLTGT